MLWSCTGAKSLSFPWNDSAFPLLSLYPLCLYQECTWSGCLGRSSCPRRGDWGPTGRDTGMRVRSSEVTDWTLQGGWDHAGLGVIAGLLHICPFKILRNLLGSPGETKVLPDLGDTWLGACPPTTIPSLPFLTQARVLRIARHHFFPPYFILEEWGLCLTLSALGLRFLL